MLAFDPSQGFAAFGRLLFGRFRSVFKAMIRRSDQGGRNRDRPGQQLPVETAVGELGYRTRNSRAAQQPIARAFDRRQFQSGRASGLRDVAMMGFDRISIHWFGCRRPSQLNACQDLKICGNAGNEAFAEISSCQSATSSVSRAYNLYPTDAPADVFAPAAGPGSSFD